MVNSEDIPPPRRSSTTTAPANLEYGQSPIKSQTIYESQAPVHENRRDIRPPQPFALKTRGQDDFPSHSSYVHTGIQFPHQQIISLDLRGGNVPPGQNLSHSPSIGHQQPQYIQRESYPGPNQPSNRSFGNSTPLSQTPTSSTPGSTGGYTNFQRPSSSRSTTTPISAQHASSFLRESPQPANRQLRTSLQSQNGLHYMSQPSTPLGPPLTYSRPSLSIHSGSPVGHDHQRTLSGGSHGHQQVITPSSATSGSPLNHRGQYSRSSIPSNVSLRERGGSESISPKTRLSDLPQLHERESLSNNVHQSYSGVEPSKRKADRDTSELLTASSDLNKETSLKELSGDNSLLNAEVQLSETTCSESTEFSKYGPSKYISESDVKVLASTSLDTKPIYRPHLDTELHFNPPSSSFSRSAKPATSLVPASQVSTQPEIPSKALSYPSDMPPSLLRSDSIILHEQPRSFRISSTNDIADTTTLQNDVADQPNKADPFGNGVTLTSQPARKKPKLKHSGSEPMASVTQKSEADVSPPSSASTLKTKKRTLHAPRITTWEEVPVWAQSTKGPSRTKTLFVESLKRAAGQNLKVKPSRYVNITNIVQHDDNHTSTPQHLPLSSIQSVVDDGPLGHWEPSITNKIPYEEVGRLISDFMYREVVVKTDIGVGPAGGAANLGAIFEIEAKIGQLIDQNTNDRLALPVLNECVVSHNSNLRFRFESSMTEVCLAPSLSRAFPLTSGVDPTSNVQSVSQQTSCRISANQIQ